MRNKFIIRRYGLINRFRGFTLIELLVVIAVISLLLAVLVPVLNSAKRKAHLVVCASNLHNIGVGIHAYAQNHNDTIPCGPEGLPMMGSNFYTATGNVTSLISLYNGSPVGLGLLLNGYLGDQPKVLFCPGADQPSDAATELSRVGKLQAQSDYYYRHGSVAMLYGKPDSFQIRLSGLGRNRQGRNIMSLAMDVQFVANESLAIFGVMTRTAHRRKAVNVLYADNSVVRKNNSDDHLTINIGGYPYDSLDKILKAFELADTAR